jgi:hypothetical protein
VTNRQFRLRLLLSAVLGAAVGGVVTTFLAGPRTVYVTHEGRRLGDEAMVRVLPSFDVRGLPFRQAVRQLAE